MTQSSASRALLDEPFWFCLKAKPKREHLATLGIRFATLSENAA